VELVNLVREEVSKIYGHKKLKELKEGRTGIEER